MKSHQESFAFDRSMPRSALNRLADLVLSRITVVGGTAARIGHSLCIKVSDSLRSGGSSGGTFLARIDGGSYTDERYNVVEIEILGQTNGKWCVRDKPGGKAVVACNITEMGAADVFDADTGSSVSMSQDETPCTTVLASGSGSASWDGRTYDGFHGILKTPSRIVYDPERLVEVRSYRAKSGDLCYYFSTIPCPIIPASYYFDETCLDDGCPDGEHWAGYMTGFAVTDDESGDSIPECS